MENTEKLNLLIKICSHAEQMLQTEAYFLQEGKNDIVLESFKSTLEKLKNKSYTVAVIAAMKAGKSTTLNAVLAEELLPNETAACTISRTEIKYSKTKQYFVNKHFKDGTIKKIIGIDSHSLQSKFLEDIREMRKSGSVHNVEMYGLEHPLEALTNQNYEGLVENFLLIDTPGPNEASNGDFNTSELKDTTYYQLRNADTIVFLLDYQVYKSETNATLLKEIFLGREDLKKDSEKIFFVVNKLDTRTSKDPDEKLILESIKKLIKHQTGGVIENPKVIGISSLMALYARTIKNGQINEESIVECKKIYGMRYMETIVHEGIECYKPISDEELSIKLWEDSNFSKFEEEVILNTFLKSSGKLITSSQGILLNRLEALYQDLQSSIKIQNQGINEIKIGIESSKIEIAELTKEAESSFKEMKINILQYNQQMKAKVEAIPSEIKEIISQTLYEFDDHYDSTDSYFLNRIATDIQKTCKVNVENYILKKQDEIIRMYEAYKHEIYNQIYLNINDLSKKADSIIKDNLHIDVMTSGMFDLEVNENYFEATIKTTSNEVTLSNDEFSNQTKRGTNMAAAGAAIGMTLGGPVGAVIGGVLGFLGGIGTYNSDPQMKKEIKYHLSTVKLKEQIKEDYDKKIESLYYSFDGYITGELESVQTCINDLLSRFSKQSNQYLDELIVKFEKNRDKKVEHIKYLRQLEKYVQELKALINGIEV